MTVGFPALSSTSIDPPVVIPINFTLTIAGMVPNQTVGTVSARNNPNTWIISSGNTAGYFVISYAGVITVTSGGVVGITSGTYVLTVTATNIYGSGMAQVNIMAA